MKIVLLMAIAVMGLGNVWAAQIIGVARDTVKTDGVTCIHAASPTSSSSTQRPLVTNTSLPSFVNSTLDPSVYSGHPSPEGVSYMPPTPSTHSTQSSSQLSTPAKAGIIAVSIIFFLALLLLILEYTYLRRKRQDGALGRAIDEVERGTELKESTASEIKENTVLESRVEIVVDGEEEGSVRDSWDEESQWDACTEGGDSDGDLGEWGRDRVSRRERNGMSLPRTEG